MQNKSEGSPQSLEKKEATHQLPQSRRQTAQGRSLRAASRVAERSFGAAVITILPLLWGRNEEQIVLKLCQSHSTILLTNSMQSAPSHERTKLTGQSSTNPG
jgi:hypothetical protein